MLPLLNPADVMPEAPPHCAHHWLIAPPRPDGSLTAACKLCGAERAFMAEPIPAGYLADQTKRHRLDD